MPFIDMDTSIHPARVASSGDRKKLAYTLSNLFHIRVPSSIRIRKVKSLEQAKTYDSLRDDRITASLSLPMNGNYEKALNRASMEALLARIFATISSVKASYAQLQVAQSPYDADEIQAADRSLVYDLKVLSELKQCFLKKQLDSSLETSLILAEMQELKSLLKSYEITGKKLECEMKLKGSEATFLKEKLDDCNKHNKTLEKRLNPSGVLSALDNLHLSALSPAHFITLITHSFKSIRTYVRLLMSEMESASWNLDGAACAIVPNVLFWKSNHKCYAFESFISREMFEGFHSLNFAIPIGSKSTPEQPERFENHRAIFFNRFMELWPVKPMDYLAENPQSGFAKFCRVKYLQAVHPKMESAFFGGLHHRRLVESGEFPETSFFACFVEMAKRVWALHCVASALDTEASIFQARKGTEFSEVYMESVTDEESGGCAESVSGEVAFTVFPGFRVGKTVVQCRVYLSRGR